MLASLFPNGIESFNELNKRIMNENINLCELLEGHEGETFYSPVCGNVILLKVSREYLVLDNGYYLSYSGKLHANGECMLFPSKDQRDWNKWAKEQKPKVPKTFDEIPLVERDYLTRPGNIPFELNKLQKSALALIKIHQLIEVGYGGNITNEEWKDSSIEKFIIVPTNDGFKIDHRFKLRAFRHIAFRTRKQAEEFLSYPENVQLLKDFYMI